MNAQFIHHHSRRSTPPFVAINCAALPEGLLESEMFGHLKGAFTGAVRDKPGLLEAAHGGTLRPDELIEMANPIHAKLLPGIHDGLGRRVGGGTEIRPEDLQLTSEGESPATAKPASLISTLLEDSYHAARDRVIAQFERQYLTWLVNRAGGNMSKAARIAGVDRTTLYRLMERHGLQRSPTAGWVVEREPGPAAGAMDDLQVEVPAGEPGGQAA